MTKVLLLWSTLLLISTVWCHSNQEDARKYLDELESRYSEACNKAAVASFSFRINITDQGKEASEKAEKDFLKFEARVQKEILEKFPDWRDFKDKDIKRQLFFLSIKGPGTMDPANVAKMVDLGSEMERDFSTATVCKYQDPSNCTVRLEQIEKIIVGSQDPTELLYYFTAWHDKLSEKIPPSKYHRYVQYNTEMAKGNKFKDMCEMWLAYYDDGSEDYTAEKFEKQILRLWEEIKPMYEILHGYVRMNLRKKPENEKLIDKCGYIPVYLTGNMWAKSWGKFQNTQPYPDVPNIAANEQLVKKGFTPLKIFKAAESFFTGLGLPPMTETFWEKSLLERPNDGRQVMCAQAMAQDFCLGGNSTDFRIKQCTEVSMYHLVLAHHEMGHIVYYQQFAHQPFIYRQGANVGFHEAVGDAITLSSVTPKHLQCVLGLDLKQDPSICDNGSAPKTGPVKVTENDMNYLYSKALNIFSFIPFALATDVWRWEAFEGKLTPDQYNKRWWEIRKEIQGVIPGTDRFSNPDLFDPASKYHISADVEYLRYFINVILEFQFYAAMCIAAGEFDPKNPNSRLLHQCDVSGSKKAGTLLSNMLQLGMSKPWPKALEAIAGTTEISIEPMKNYFKPILDFMEEEMDKNGEISGFGESCEEVKKTRGLNK